MQKPTLKVKKSQAMIDPTLQTWRKTQFFNCNTFFSNSRNRVIK